MNGVNNKVINFIFGIILPIQRLVSKLIKNFFIFFNKQTYRNKIFISIAIAGYLFLIYHNYWVHFSKDSPFNDPKSLAYLEDFMSRASYFSETEFLNKNYFNLNFLTCKIFIFTLFLNKNYFTNRVFNFLLLIISLHFNNNFDSSTTDSTRDEKNLDWFEYTLKRGVDTSGATDAYVMVDIFVGTGPDFDVVFFINCPVYTYLPPPTAIASG